MDEEAAAGEAGMAPHLEESEVEPTHLGPFKSYRWRKSAY
jgi:hypothetical protein